MPALGTSSPTESVPSGAVFTLVAKVPTTPCHDNHPAEESAMGVIDTVTDAIANAFSQRDTLVSRLASLDTQFAEAFTADEQAIAAQQAIVDELDAPRRKLERLKAQASDNRRREARERA